MKKTIKFITSLCISASTFLSPCVFNYGTAANAYTGAINETYLLSSPSKAADSGNCGEGVTWTLDDAGTLTISGKGTVSASAFAENEDIKSAVIKEGITGIGKSAFDSCKGLTSVTMPESLTSIADGAFSGCKNLSSVTMSKPTEIGYDAFGETKWLNDARQKDPLVIVNGILIDGITSSGEVKVPDTVTSIAAGAFNCNENITSVVIPKSVKFIGKIAFGGCMELGSVTIPDTVTSIGEGAFSYTKWIEGKQTEDPLVIVNGILIDGTMSFGDVVIPDTVKSIADSAFVYSMIDSVSIPDTVTSIGNNVFSCCESLASVKLPKSLTVISENMFTGCANLKTLTIPNTVTSIGTNAFDQCTSLEAITVPDSVKSIDDAAFQHCESLRSIKLPASVAKIGSGAFWYTGLETITILNSKCEIDGEATTICNKFNDEDESFGYTGVICGNSGSTAEAYAKKYGYTFKALSAAPETSVTSAKTATTTSTTSKTTSKTSTSTTTAVTSTSAVSTELKADARIVGSWYASSISGRGMEYTPEDDQVVLIFNDDFTYNGYMKERDGSYTETIGSWTSAGNKVIAINGRSRTALVYDPDNDTLTFSSEKETDIYKRGGRLTTSASTTTSAAPKTTTSTTSKTTSTTAKTSTSTTSKTTSTTAKTSTSTTSKTTSTTAKTSTSTTSKTTSTTAKTSTSTTSKTTAPVTTTTANSGKLSVTVWGDVSCNGKIDVVDIVLLNKYLNNPTYTLSDQAKVNADISAPQDKTGKAVDPKGVKLTGADSEEILMLLLKSKG
ncbi:MAG: leucine-rich repeat protein [Ruminococcus sp.]|uniref:leucine-rich repeat protein n=1 Tax=Ruminococcus sp. TaxID=41978 RepID=UPI0025D54792|nr:leucine-rich repeat protein [Ruminococcus sp.]MCR4793583.1 leucine-rich repeat protein [Ruminococcus sp.]